MIDGVKIHIYLICSFNEFVKNSLFDFHAKLNDATGEYIKFPKTAKYKNLTITAASENYVLLKGSLHEFFNGGSNDSYFNYSQLFYTIINLCTTLDIDSYKSKFKNLEFGVNIIVPFNVDEFLNRLVCYKNSPFKVEKDEYKTYYVCKQQRYWIKIYNKGKQYGRPENILRFEIKVVKMKHIEFTGIKCLSDLLDKNNLVQLGVLLEQAFREIIYTDRSIMDENLTDKERLILAKGNDKDYREGLNRKQRHKFNLLYNKLINSHGHENYFETVKKLIPETWEQLLENNLGNVLTDFDNLSINDERERINPLLERLNCSQDKNSIKRNCQTCGKDISIQKKGSRFCSEKYFGKDVKSCRNKESNPKNNFKKRVRKILSKPKLFDDTPYFKLTPEQREWIRVKLN